MGKVISDNVQYGNKFIKQLETSLRLEFPSAKGFSARNLSRMKTFYEEYKDFSILPPAVAKLPWAHNYVLLEKVKERKIRLWYAEACIKNGWSYLVSFLLTIITFELFMDSTAGDKQQMISEFKRILNGQLSIEDFLKEGDIDLTSDKSLKFVKRTVDRIHH